METLNDIIAYELIKAGYENLKDNVWKKKDYPDFWVLSSIDGTYNLEDIQERLYYDLEAMRNTYKEAEKNTSLLILNLVDFKDINKVISSENDIYYFKKYVIQYTNDEFKELEPYISSIEKNGIGNLLMDKPLFDQIKKNLNSPLTLLYMIAHKLPFVMIGTEKKSFDAECPIECSNSNMKDLLSWIDSIDYANTLQSSDTENRKMKIEINKHLNINRDE